MMKRRQAMILSMALALGCPVAASAAVLNTEGEQSTVVKYGVDSSYQVTIPESVEFAAGETQKDATVVVSKDCLIPVANYLTVSLTASENYLKSAPAGTETRFRLAAKEGSETAYIPYTIMRNGTNKLHLDNSAGGRITIIPYTQFARETEDLEYVLTFALAGEPKAAGTYTDTLTFNVALQPF